MTIEEIEKRSEKILKEKGKIYGDSFDFLSDSSCIDLCMMKLRRVQNMNSNYQSQYAEKYKDELYDIRNYLTMLIRRIEFREKVGEK